MFADLTFARVTANTPERTMIDASLKIAEILKIIERTPATTAPRAAPTLNSVDK